jgi:hypothetical protein
LAAKYCHQYAFGDPDLKRKHTEIDEDRKKFGRVVNVAIFDRVGWVILKKRPASAAFQASIDDTHITLKPAKARPGTRGGAGKS